MYIKTLTIQGFKSYRDQTTISSFSPKHNVVVGRNGSGKSNFFAAIRFVLSDAYTSMSQEERQALLHEGVSTTTTLSAYVEIIFDNSDNRFPTGNPEVIIRRTIGLKKDEYSLDKKSTSKADVMNLLESAGFSNSNPYYIVPQGRITALTNAKDHERLALLKQVAGTKVYETRRTESLKIMHETNTKRAKINELLTYIDSRLSELESEKEELKAFQEKDKERRCLEYALYQRELIEVGEALEEIEEDRKQEVHSSNVRREKFNVRETEIADIEKSISTTQHTLSTLTLQKTDAQKELEDLIRQKTRLQLVITDLQSTSNQSTSLREELTVLEQTIATRQETLDELLPSWLEATDNEKEQKRLLDECTSRLSALFAKQGRITKFTSKSARDAFLKSEISSLQTHKANQTHALQTSQTELANAKQSLQEVEAQIADTQAKIEDGKTRIAQLADQMNGLRNTHAELVEERKDLWREDTKLESLVSRASEQLRNSERVLAGMMDKANRIIARNPANWSGVYGPLYKLFTIPDPKFSTAIELTAGNSLFHVVVDNDSTASRLLEIMLKEKTGRVTFVPLNRIHPSVPTLPASTTTDAIPLLSKISYDPLHEKAFQQVFGKTFVCRDLTIAAAYVKSHSINTITLDGDKVDRKGALTGGYHDVRRSRITAIKDVTSWDAKYTEESTKSREVKERIAVLDQRITKITGETSILGAQQQQIREARERLQSQGFHLTKEKERLLTRIGQLEKDISELEVELGSIQARMEAYQNELKEPLSRGLTRDEERQMEELGKEVETRRKEVKDAARRKAEVESKKSSIEIELNERLRRRKEEILNKLDSASGSQDDDEEGSGGLEDKQRQLETLNNSINSLNKKIAATERQSATLQTELNNLQNSLEEHSKLQSEDTLLTTRQQKHTERYIAKRSMLQSRREEVNRNIRDLGVLPEEAFDKYTGDKVDKLVKLLHKTNETLKSYSHINKKAFEQYNSFTKQRDNLLERREDLDKSAKAIEELVEVLDQRKDEAIERTFKQVAKNFEEVFEKLVPAGRGRLIIQRKVDQDEDEEQEETQASSVDNYTGISIKVSFNSKVDEGLRIQQLSGGQKSLVALATVFAIQMCDPAPFYLFDEIDANLDAQYRTAVASMIQSLSSGAQFIVTTFRPEMLVTADKFFGVLFNNQKVSSIREIRREEAMEFVDQEAVGR
ncbi:Structural maintenance of chromosomes protein 3 [Paramarasmius palmivorus]|uniref:Structural maintenance of chromosomes protein n=1 Tax=Paramarasmius palmivorus TaxID=297713 RepID=A0AAW0C9N4_9AGAR